MTGELESQYRRSARWYPASWRVENEDVLIGTLLDVADAEGRTRPSFADRWNLGRNAVAAHTDALMPSNVRDGIATNAVAMCGAFALIYFFFAVWAPFLPDRDVHMSGAGFGPFLSTGAFTATAAVGLLIATFTRQRQARNAAAAATIATALVTLVAGRITGDPASAATVNLAFLATLAGAAVIGTPRRSRTVLVATAAWLVGMIAALAVNRDLLGIGEREWWVNIANPYSVPPTAMLALVISLALLSVDRRLGAVVTASATLPWLAVSALQSLDATHPEPLTIAILTATIAAALTVMALALRRIASSTRRTSYIALA